MCADRHLDLPTTLRLINNGIKERRKQIWFKKTHFRFRSVLQLPMLGCRNSVNSQMGN